MTSLAPHFVKINGKSFPYQENEDVHVLLKRLQLNPKAVVIEHNGNALSPSDFEKIILCINDSLEIVQATAGG